MKPEAEVGLEAADADDVLAIIGIAGTAPFDFLSQIGGQEYLPKANDLVPPNFPAGDVIVDGLISLHDFYTSTEGSFGQ